MSPNEFYRITDKNDRFYPAFYAIYSHSFPIHEQRNAEQQEAAFRDNRYYLVALIENDILLSFICYWDFDEYVYIEHFAVNGEMRGRQIGSHSLALFAETVGKTIILEIDPLIDEVSRKRYRFYEKLGYITNHYRHHHPAYNPIFPPHELVVLSYPGQLDENKYNRFNHDLTYIVMA